MDKEILNPKSKTQHPTSMLNNEQHLSLVIVGHVDHGKSTIIGRLLADTGSLPDGKLEQVKENCRRNSKPFEYAFLLDALKDEQSQGITIDSARCFFNTEKRKYIIIDAPGHIEFLKNMVTGASRAEAALLVIDANEGVMENSRRHGYMLSMLGIKQVAVLVNKMDLVDYSKEVFENIKSEYFKFLKEIDITPKCFIPVSGMEGDYIAKKTDKLNWFEGETVLDTLDSFETARPQNEKPFRMPVQAVYKFTKGGDTRRIVAGTVDSGSLKIGDKVIFYPSGKTSTVKTIEKFNAETLPNKVTADEAVGFTLNEQIYVGRGEIATKEGENKPLSSTKLKVNLFWLGKNPMEREKEYFFKLGTAKVRMYLEKINRIIDASNLENETKDFVEKHDVAECIFKLEKAVSFDKASDNEKTSRFVIVDEFEITGGGIVVDTIEDETSRIREQVFLRNYKWEKSIISKQRRAEKYNQKPTLILITGEKDTGKKPVAKILEKKLFEDGKIIYFLGMGNILYGVDADLKSKSENGKEEHIRRFSEIANIMLDSGAILLFTAIELTQNDLDIIKTSINDLQVKVVWLGEKVTTDIQLDLKLTENTHESRANSIKEFMQKEGIIFNPF